jgi:hypothetical protein
MELDKNQRTLLIVKIIVSLIVGGLLPLVVWLRGGDKESILHYAFIGLCFASASSLFQGILFFIDLRIKKKQ